MHPEVFQLLSHAQEDLALSPKFPGCFSLDLTSIILFISVFIFGLTQSLFLYKHAIFVEFGPILDILCRYSMIVGAAKNDLKPYNLLVAYQSLDACLHGLHFSTTTENTC